MKQFTFPANAQLPLSSQSASRPPTAAASSPSIPSRPQSSHGSASRPSTPLARSSSPLDLEAVNARVEKKFAYWKAFWSNVHQQHSASAMQEEKTQTSSSGAGFGGLSREEAVDAQVEPGKREQIEDVIRRMRAVREEEMADTGRRRRGSSESSAKQQSAAQERAAASASTAAGAGSISSGLHSRGWDASSKLRQQHGRQQLHRQSTAPHRPHRGGSPSLSPPAFSSPPPAVSSPFSSSASSGSPTRPSNLSRFWSEERSRPPHHQQPFSPAGRVGASGRKLSHLTLPEDAAEARQLWEAMKEEMWSHWEAVQQREEHRQQRQHDSRDDDDGDEDDEEESRRRIRSRFHDRAASPLPTPLSFSPLPPSSSSSPSLSQQAAARARPVTAHAAQAASTRHQRRPSQSQQTAFPSSGFRSPPSLASFSSFASRPSSVSATPAVPLSGWSVAALRAEMSRLSLPTAHILEKGEMVAAIAASQAQQQEVALRAQKEDAVVRELQRWAQGRTLLQLLNSLNQAEAGAAGAGEAVLTPDSSAAEVSRCYKRTLLRVHPDKSPQADWEAKLRATELFKLLHDKYREFSGNNHSSSGGA